MIQYPKYEGGNIKEIIRYYLLSSFSLPSSHSPNYNTSQFFNTKQFNSNKFNPDKFKSFKLPSPSLFLSRPSSFPLSLSIPPLSLSLSLYSSSNSTGMRSISVSWNLALWYHFPNSTSPPFSIIFSLAIASLLAQA